MSKKVIRKKVTASHDELVTASSGILTYLSKNFKVVVIATSVVAAISLSYAGGVLYKNSKNRKASAAFYSAMKAYQAKVDAVSSQPDIYKSEDEKYRASVAKFAEVAGDYKGSDVGNIALFYAADSHYRLKEYDKAMELYGRLLTGEVKDPNLHGNVDAFKLNPGILRDSALYGLAFCYEQKGDIKKAIDSLVFLTSSKDSHLREQGLVSLGRFYERNGEKEKAREAYQKFITDFPESAGLPAAKERLERLKG